MGGNKIRPAIKKNRQFGRPILTYDDGGDDVRRTHHETSGWAIKDVEELIEETP